MALDPERLQLSVFSGIQNTSQARDIEVNALQDAVDVDITNSGGIVARAGYTLAKGVAIDAGYTTSDNVTYVVSEGWLHRVNDDLSFTALCTASATTKFTDYQGAVFTSDGFQIVGSDVTDLRTSVPEQPSIVVTGGTKPAGQYNVVLTKPNASGLESGSSRVVTVMLGAPGDILITPQLADGDCNIYTTDVGGAMYANPYDGTRLGAAFINANPFPATPDCIEFHDSSLFVATVFSDYTAVFYSVPHHYHLYGYDDAYFVVPGAVIAMKSTPQGLVVGTDKGIHLYVDGDITPLASYGVVPGDPMVKLPTGEVLIHTQRGLCKAPPFEELTSELVSLPMGGVCKATYLESKGIKRYIGLHDGAGTAFNSY